MKDIIDNRKNTYVCPFINLILILIISIFSTSRIYSQSISFTPEEQQWIKSHPVIHFGYEPHWEPYEIYKNGKYGGIVGDYIKKIQKETGIKMIPAPHLTWEQSFQRFKEGKIKVLACFVETKKRSRYFSLSDPYIVDPIVIVTQKDALFLSTMKELAGKTIALPKKYYSNYLITHNYPSIKIKYYNSVKECLESLSSGKVDAYIGNINVVSYYRNNFGFSNLKIVGVTPFKHNGLCFAFNPDWGIFRGIVNKVLKNMTPKEIHDIKVRWIGSGSSNFFQSNMFKWILALFIIVLLILIFIYIQNISLKKGIKKGRKIEKELQLHLKETEKETVLKSTLLKESHHRIKNDLQTVSSILHLQADTIEDTTAYNALQKASDRVDSISLMHQAMYQMEAHGTIQLDDFIQMLFESIASGYPNSQVEPIIKIDVLTISPKSILPLTLIINELITNSFNYAFPHQSHPKINLEIQCNKEKHQLKFVYFDNGTWQENKESDLFGSSLIDAFTEQLDGTYKLTKKEGETKYIFYFENVQCN